jgi:hypothetical protein
MAKITVETVPFHKPTWSSATLKPGTEATLEVEDSKIKANQFVTFRIRKGNDLVDIVTGKPGEKKAKWTVPNLPERPKLVFDALLCEKPEPGNGFQAVVNRVTSPEAQVKGYKVAITGTDAAFVPKIETLKVDYKIDDPSGAAKKGRIEIWGDRYPTEKPLYTDEFGPANGARSWDSWSGKANAGTFAGKFITPEFSPYRFRIIIGPDEGCVRDPFGAGLGKATSAEAQFEVRFQSIEIQLQKNLPAKVKTALGMDAGQSPVLVIEPRQPTGAFAARDRLPKDLEPTGAAGIGRIRITGKRHTQIGESLNQGYSDAGNPANQGAKTKLHRVADSYMGDNTAPPNGPGGAGHTKYEIEHTLYKRPEIPVELVAKLKSRSAADQYGLFSAHAVGPAVFDVYAEDAYAEWMYSGGIAGAPVPLYDEARTYLKKAAMKVKWGGHDAPEKSGNDPVISHWRQRFVIAHDGDEEVGDTEEPFQKGKNELKVYLNRTPLTRDDAATADNTKAIKLDYAETSNKKIKLRKGLAFQGDVVWIIRTPDAALGYGAVAHWDAFPPGDNCHEYFGGDRGREPTDQLVCGLRKEYSDALAGVAYAARDTINLDPDQVAATKRERVESKAMLPDGNQKGLAGVIFSPSTMAGDKYVLEARLREQPYVRDIGWVADRPVAWNVKGRSGIMVVWRLLTVSASWRMSLKPRTRGLAAGIGEDDPDAAGRPHPGDGRIMNFVRMNEQFANGFSEWIILKANGKVAQPNDEPHQNINFKQYRKFFNDKYAAHKHAAHKGGFYKIPDDAHITNECVRWDHYRETLPPEIPADRQNVATRAIEQLAAGSTSIDAAHEVLRAIHDYETAEGAGADDMDSADLVGPAIPISPDAPKEYLAWVKKKVKDLANEYMDGLIPRIPAPDCMRVLRWPNMYFLDIYSNGDPTVANPMLRLGTAGYCRGSGQAFFFTVGGNPDTFEHEMGHSVFLIHFAAGEITNFGWKHHDHNYPHCLMGYYDAEFTVPLPTPKVGADIVINTGDRVWLCPKCLLKVRGWDEVKLPCNWTHPDVF